MANYLAIHRKKLDTLARKRLDLIRPQRRALAAKRAQITACDDNVGRLRAIDEEIASCLRLSVADIVASCRQRRT
jgi:hypothetical protein